MASIFQPLNTTSTPMQIANAIKLAIHSGQLKVGDKLPSEKELADTFGVGRSTLREGIRILSAYGVLDVRQGDGTFIKDILTSGNPFGILEYIPLSENMRHLQQFRYILETGVVGQVCGKVTPAFCQELSELTEQLLRHEEQGDYSQVIEADMCFHRKIIELTENPIIIRVYEMNSSMLSSLMTNLMTEHDNVIQDAYDAHHEIIQALRMGDAAASVEKMGKHMLEVEAYIDQYF